MNFQSLLRSLELITKDSNIAFLQEDKKVKNVQKGKSKSLPFCMFCSLLSSMFVLFEGHILALRSRFCRKTFAIIEK